LSLLEIDSEVGISKFTRKIEIDSPDSKTRKVIMNPSKIQMSQNRGANTVYPLPWRLTLWDWDFWLFLSL
jgi:hypothetical protein